MKSDRERQISYDITYMWNQKNDTNELIYKRLLLLLLLLIRLLLIRQTKYGNRKQAFRKFYNNLTFPQYLSI